MKIRLLSDLHLEFHTKANEFVVPVMPDDKDTTLVLAGDIDLCKHVHVFLEECSKQFKHVIYVLGNHEYYKANLPTVCSKIRSKIARLPNVYLLDTDTVELDGVHFVGATLWTDMDNGNPMTLYYAELKISDYHVIRTGTASAPWQRKLKPIDTSALHRAQRDYMFITMNELNKTKEPDEKIVAVSHHLPSFICVHEDFRGDNLNGAYATELLHEIEYSQPDLWIHGHAHHSNDIVVPGTNIQIRSNPRGYWPHDMNPDFDPTLIVDL
jgi:hypothetical protein